MATARRAERGLLMRVKGPFQQLSRFLQEVVLELKRVVWPSRDEASAFTVVVVITIIVVSIWVGALELVFTGIGNALKLYGG